MSNADYPGRFNLTDSNAYWRKMHGERGDDDLLDAVCHPGSPPWLNRYVAQTQRRAFETALVECGSVEKARVIEVGCGNGRWARLLRDRGASVTANDVSYEAIARNRQRIPGVSFIPGDFLALSLAPRSFDLGVTVTVIQHFPPAAQVDAVARLAEVIRPGGHLLMLENIQDQGPHVFARPISSWLELLTSHGFVPVSIRGYEFDLPLRAAGAAMKWLTTLRASKSALAESTSVGAASGSPAASLKLRLAQVAIQGPAVALSYPAEALSRLILPNHMATHAAMLLRRSDRTVNPPKTAWQNSEEAESRRETSQ